MQFSAINHDILHSLFLENHLKLLEIAHTLYLLGSLVWVLAFHFVCKWASQKVRKMSSGTTLGKNWVGVSLGCWERTSVNRRLQTRGPRKRERGIKIDTSKGPWRQLGRPCRHFLLQFARDKMLNDYRVRGHALDTRPGAWPGKNQRISQQTNHGRGRPGRGPALLCVMTQRGNLQDASLIFRVSVLTVSAGRHVTYSVLAGPDTPPWPIAGLGLTLTLHSASIINTDTLSHKLRHVLFSRNSEWMRNDPRGPDPVWSLIGDTGFLLKVHDVISRPFIETHKKFEEFFIYQTVMKIWGFNNWTFRQKMKVPHQIIYNETLRPTASLHIWILFSEFINLGGWLQRKVQFLST